MKVLVAVKQVIDSNVKIRVRQDKSGIDLANAKKSINPFDEIAVEEAVRLKEVGKIDEIVLVSIGPSQAQEAIRVGLAMGADRGILIQAEYPIEPLSVAKLLKAVIADELPQMVILGKQAIDDDCNQTGQMLAGLLDWGQATFAQSINLIEDVVEVTREVDGGLQTIRLNLPAIITTDLRLNEPRYVSLPGLMKAKKKRIDIKAVNGFGIDITPRLQIIETNEPPLRKSGIKVASAMELVEKLRNEAFVL